MFDRCNLLPRPSDPPTEPTMQSASEKLLRCPFCGSAAEMEPWHGGAPTKQIIRCLEASNLCEVGPRVTGETPAEAIALWNTRATQVPAPAGIDDAAVERALRSWMPNLFYPDGNWIIEESAADHRRDMRAALSAAAIVPSTPPQAGGVVPFQSRVAEWVMACLGETIGNDELERQDRFLEEVFEALQARGYPEDRVDALKRYTYDRKPGEPRQEVGGVMTTLAAWCRVMGFDMMEAGEAELARVWTKVDQIRAKQAAKPKHSPLPVAASPEPPAASPVEGDDRADVLCEAIRYALEDRDCEGLKWLRAWNEGDPEAMAELDAAIRPNTEASHAE